MLNALSVAQPSGDVLDDQVRTIKVGSRWLRPRPGAITGETITVRTVSASGDTFRRVHVSYVTDEGYEGTFYGLVESWVAQFEPVPSE